MVEKFDAIIIGTGQSGPSLAKSLAKVGKKVAIMERGRFGGTCVNVGCTPTKTLVATAKIAHSVRNGKMFGINVEKFQIDFKAIRARKDAIVNESTEWVEKALRATEGCTVFKGEASFVGPHEVKIGNELVEGDLIFINVGARANIHDLPGLKTIPYFTNESLLDIDYLPEHLLILGGGYIGLEFAQIFFRFGSKVTVIQKDPFVMPKEDQDVSQAIADILSREGIQIYTDAKNIQVLLGSKAGNIQIQFEKNGKNQIIPCTHLLVATGRVPNTDALGLEKAGVKVDKKGFIVVDDQLRTSQPHIWALGDCNGKGAFTHTSYNDFEIVSQNLLENGSRKVTERIPIYALFTDPPLGRVGMTEREAKLAYEKVLVAKMPMTGVSRAIEKGETEGFLKIVVDADSKRILGASFLGTGCDETIHAVAEIMYAKVSYTVLEKAVHIHPTVTEIIPTLLSRLQL